MHKDASKSMEILKALADDIRLSVAQYIASSPDAVSSCSVVTSCAKRNELSQPAMSHHFKKLVDAGVLIIEKKGTENFYRYNHNLCQSYGIDISKL